MASKFFVYAGGRWRELETEDGRLAGWGCANFIFFRRGRLVMARRVAVLRALKALAAGRGTAAQDGLPLSKYEPLHEIKERKKHRSPVSCQACQHQKHLIASHHCMQCANNIRFDRLLDLNTSTVSTRCVATADASVQVTQPVSAYPPPRTSSEDGLELAKIATLSLRNKKGKFVKGTPHTNRMDKSTEQTKNTEKTATKTGEIRTQRNYVTQNQKAVDIYVKNKNKNRKRKHSSSSESALTNKQKESMENVKELVIDEKDVELLRRYLRNNNFGVVDVEQFDKDEAYKERVFYRINPLVIIERCPRIANMLKEHRREAAGVSLEHFISVLGLRTAEQRSSPEKRYKTRATASQIINPTSDKDVYLHENDKENESGPKKLGAKARKRRAKVLREDNARINDIRAGSRKSVEKARTSSPLRKMHMLVDRVVELSSNISSSSSGSGSSGSGSSGSDGEVFQAPRPHAPAGLQRGGDVVPQASARSTGSGKVTGAGVKSAGSGPKSSGGGGKSSGGGGQASGGGGKASREYSALEDAAIVSWLRVGDRARRVNGNRLWRELQPVHAARAGTARSWHSLRNRYLRYILPALSTLALPGDASRLRAAAATGELKACKLPRRNSLLVLPRMRSAWSRRRRTPARSPTPTHLPTQAASPALRRTRLQASTSLLTGTEKASAAPRPPTPTYSEVLQRFASTNTTDSSDEFAPSAAASPQQRQSRRSARRTRTSAAKRNSSERVAPSAAESRRQRYIRRSDRHAGEGAKQTPEAGPKVETPKKKRRLYNPKIAL